jgi:hypothetical protein
MKKARLSQPRSDIVELTSTSITYRKGIVLTNKQLLSLCDVFDSPFMVLIRDDHLVVDSHVPHLQEIKERLETRLAMDNQTIPPKSVELLVPQFEQTKWTMMMSAIAKSFTLTSIPCAMKLANHKVVIQAHVREVCSVEWKSFTSDVLSFSLFQKDNGLHLIVQV